MRKRSSSSRGRHLVRNQVSEEEEQIDRLSNLPEHLLLVILSLLPTPVAARTSLVSRRFQQIWDSTHLKKHCNCRHPYDNVDDCDLLCREPTYPLFHLTLYVTDKMSSDHVASLLNKAQSLGLRHLTIYLRSRLFVHPFTFSVDNLLSLSFRNSMLRDSYFLPSFMPSTHLKSLSLSLFDFDCGMFNEIVSRLCFLEDLFVELDNMHAFNLTSQTLRKLKLTLNPHLMQTMVSLSMPILEFFDFKIISQLFTPDFSSEMPKLKKAFISHSGLCDKTAPPICDYLKNMMNVETLKLDLREHWSEMRPFHMILDPAGEPPMFPNLKSLDVSLCFYEENMEDLIRLLQNSPALESLNLIPKGPNYFSLKSEETRELLLGYKTRLPRSADGNYQHACFKDLHIEDKRKQLIERLTKKITS